MIRPTTPANKALSGASYARTSLTRLAILVAASVVVAGCQLTPTALTGDKLQRIESELETLETMAAATQAELATLNSQRSEQLEDVNKRLLVIDRGVKRVPKLITSACQSPEVVPVTCEEVAIQSVVSKDGKMIVGSAEHLWVSPPGLSLTASVDTGTTSNSIHATDVTPFERDGDNWVRFTLLAQTDSQTKDEAAEGVEVEKKIVRQLRISKRPVVRLRVKLGNVLDSFEFILTDRSDDKHSVQLGRNFLQDVALVDVGKQFVQPRFDNSNKKPDSGR